MRRAGVLLVVAACTRPAEQRAEAELSVGSAAITDAEIRIDGGLAAIRELADGRVELWSSAPILDIELAVDSTAAGNWTFTIRNSLPDAVLSTGGAVITREPGQHPTVGIFNTVLAEGTHRLHLAPPDGDLVAPFKVAAMADIQTALPVVDQIFARISEVPDLRFVVGMGDITERSLVEEYDLFERQLVSLEIPFYTTLGNHELWAPYARFHDRFGRGSFQFQFKGAYFTFADSGDAGIDPLVEDWIVDWLATAHDHTSIFLTHFPPLDPVGIRYGGFRSTQDARRLIARLVEGNVDLMLYGHIHTYLAYEQAGIPAFISGGGGANPMAWDGIDRHFLVVDIDPAGAKTIRSVDVHRVD